MSKDLVLCEVVGLHIIYFFTLNPPPLTARDSTDIHCKNVRQVIGVLNSERGKLESLNNTPIEGYGMEHSYKEGKCWIEASTKQMVYIPRE